MEAFPWFPAGTPFFFLSRGPPPFPFPKKRREKARKTFVDAVLRAVFKGNWSG